MNDKNILIPDSDEHRCVMNLNSPDRTSDSSNTIILDVIEAFSGVRSNNQNITSVYLEFKYIDDIDPLYIITIEQTPPDN